MSFWDKTAGNPANIAAQAHLDKQLDVVLDEQAVSEIQGEEYDVFEDEEQDMSEIMSDANLRLEMGRLYQMILQNDIFAETNADPRAIKNVQREIRKLVRERMETMLGIRQEQVAVHQTVVSSPFNDLEVTALKMLASRVTKGASEEASQPQQAQVEAPKKDGITAISGTLRPNNAPSVGKPLRREAKQPLQKSRNPDKAPAQVVKSALVKDDESLLKKPIEQMTAEELAAHNAAAETRSKQKYAAMPPNLVPHPTPGQLEQMYMIQATSNPAPGSAVARMTDLINGRNQ